MDHLHDSNKFHSLQNAGLLVQKKSPGSMYSTIGLGTASQATPQGRRHKYTIKKESPTVYVCLPLSQVGTRRKRCPGQFGQDGMGSIPATPSMKHASCFPPSSLPASIEISIKLVVCLCATCRSSWLSFIKYPYATKTRRCSFWEFKKRPPQSSGSREGLVEGDTE